MYLAYMYCHLFEVVCYDVGWVIQVILYSLFLGFRDSWPIMQSLVLAFPALPLGFMSCPCWLGEMTEKSNIMMNI